MQDVMLIPFCNRSRAVRTCSKLHVGDRWFVIRAQKTKSPELSTQGWIEIRWLEVRDYPCPELGPIMIAAIMIDWTEILRMSGKKYRVLENSQGAFAS